MLHVVNGEYYAGAERVQDQLAMHLPEFGCQVGFACIKANEFPARRDSQGVPLSTFSVRHPWSQAAFGEIAKLAIEGGYDVLHSHTTRSAWAALSAGEIARLPVVHTMHDVFLGQDASIPRRFLNRYTTRRLQEADAVTTVSPATQQLADRLGIGSWRQMILNGVPTARSGFQRRVPGPWTIGTVGLIRPCKGVEVLIRAVARLRDQGAPVKAIVVGTFHQVEYEREVMNLVRGLNVQSLIDFVGFSSDVPQRLEELDLFVMPSVGPEGLPMVILEAMAHGLPTIGSDVRGVGDLVRTGVDGMIFPVGDDAALAGIVSRFLSQELDWQAMSRAAFARHDAEFTVQRMASQFADVYRRVRL